MPTATATRSVDNRVRRTSRTSSTSASTNSDRGFGRDVRSVASRSSSTLRFLQRITLACLPEVDAYTRDTGEGGQTLTGSRGGQAPAQPPRHCSVLALVALVALVA